MVAPISGRPASVPRNDDELPPPPPPAVDDSAQNATAAAQAMAALRQLPGLREHTGVSSLARGVTAERGASRTDHGGEIHAQVRAEGRLGPLSGSVTARADASISDRREGEVRIARAEASAQIQGQVGVERGRFSSHYERTEGVRGSYEARIPGGQPGSGVPTPLNPRALPVGGSIEMSAERYSNIGFGATFRGLATETNISDVNRISARIERTGENTVRVSAGPSRQLNADNTFGFSQAGVQAIAGRHDTLEGAQTRSAEFDLSTPEGTAGYQRFLSAGRLPTENGPGISGVQTVRSVSLESTPRVALQVGDLGGSVELEGARGSRQTTQLADGTAQTQTDLRWGSNVQMGMQQQHGADGAEALEARRYTYQFQLDATSAAALNAVGGERAEPLRAGQNVEVSLTQAQMEQLREAAAASANGTGRRGGAGPNAFEHLLTDTGGRAHDTLGFATAVARANDGYGLSTMLLRLAPNGQAPISVTVR